MPSIINATTTNGVAISPDNSGSLQLATNNGTTAVTIDTSQNVGIGTSSPTSRLGVSGAAQFIGVSPSVFPTTGSGIEVVAGVSGQENYIQAYNRSGSSWQNLQINSAQTVFSTSGSERMRIDSGGKVLIGCTAEPNNTINGFKSDVNYTIMSSSGQPALYVNRNTNTGTVIELRYNNSTVGTISTNGSNTSYNTSSDYRLKENIAPMTGALAKVSQLKPCTYTWKSTGETGEGFIAHELQVVVPECVTGEKDAVEFVDIKDEEGNVIRQEEKPVYQGVDTSFLVATLTAAIQELKAELDTVKSELNTLKNPPVEGTE